jgi:serine/threonine-protein kinase
MSSEETHAGQPRVGGRYELGELLGRGGMAEVRKGNDIRLGRVVAVKRLRTDMAADTTFQTRFRREAQSAASLNHPAIVAVYDTGEETATDGSGVSQPYIVMEYVAGRTLRDILREGRKILPERALEITAGVLDALDYSHRAGIVHRDIKPANVMLTPAGDVKVMDFGIARAVSDASSTMTQTAAVIGTAQYLSPEQARGETVDSRSDVYSTGCLLYELLTGRPPFVGDSPVSVAYQHVREEAAPPSSLDPDLPPEVDAIVMKALSKRIEDRYQSAAAMRADIERFLAGKPVSAPPVPLDAGAAAFGPADDPAETTSVLPGGTETDQEERRSRRWPLVVLALLVIALIVAALVLGPKLFTSPSQRNTVPSVIGMTKAQAVKAINHAGLQVGNVTQRPSASVPKGHVSHQDPNYPKTLPPGRKVDLTISTGKPNVTVPYTNGEDKSTAAAKITAAGLKPHLVKRQSDLPADTVIRTSPTPGTRVTKGSPVTVYYSSGPPRVPNVVGMQVGQARQVLSSRGFNSSVRYDKSTPARKGEVLDEIPNAGTTQPHGATIVLTVSDYQPPPPTHSTSPHPTNSPSSSPTQSQSPGPSPSATISP